MYVVGTHNFISSAGFNYAQFYMGFMKHLYGSSPFNNESYTSINELSYFTQVLHRHKLEISTNTYSFKLCKPLMVMMVMVTLPMDLYKG